ncbi:META domain-containing protein [Diaphorobacter nitroreducens]
MKLQLSNVFAWLLVSLAVCTQTAFAQADRIGTQDAKAADLHNALSANEWALVKIFNNNGIEETDWPRSSGSRDSSVSLSFDRSRHIFGQVCNFLTWRYSLLGSDRIKVSQEFMTMAACDEAGVMQLELRVQREMQSARNAHIDVDNDGTPRLTLRTALGSRMVFSGRAAKVN